MNQFTTLNLPGRNRNVIGKNLENQLGIEKSLVHQHTRKSKKGNLGTVKEYSTMTVAEKKKHPAGKGEKKCATCRKNYAEDDGDYSVSGRVNRWRCNDCWDKDKTKAPKRVHPLREKYSKIMVTELGTGKQIPKDQVHPYKKIFDDYENGIEKAVVRAHTRKSKKGKLAQVKSYHKIFG